MILHVKETECVDCGNTNVHAVFKQSTAPQHDFVSIPGCIGSGPGGKEAQEVNFLYIPIAFS